MDEATAQPGLALQPRVQLVGILLGLAFLQPRAPLAFADAALIGMLCAQLVDMLMMQGLLGFRFAPPAGWRLWLTLVVCLASGAISVTLATVLTGVALGWLLPDITVQLAEAVEGERPVSTS